MVRVMEFHHLISWMCVVIVNAGPTDRGKNDISLNTEKLNELGSQGQLLLRHIAITTHSCGIKEQPKFRRKLLRNSPVTCNDGTPAGYYIRKSHGSSKWIVFLEAGWFCFDRTSCAERYTVMHDFMSSRNWPRHKKGSGILSWDPEENPFYFHANMVIVPYCSSDSWSGTRNSSSRDDFSFMGSLILEEVMKELLKKGLRNAKKLLVMGSSAGGTGVLINLDRIADQVKQRAPGVEVRGVVDAGWFLDNEPYKPRHCRDAYTCSPTDSINKGTEYWQPRVPEDCKARYPSEVWRCYFGHRIYPSLKSKLDIPKPMVFAVDGPFLPAPVFIIQNLYDAAQIKVDNVFEDKGRGSDLSNDQWMYLLRLGEEVKDTLLNASAVFAPACVAHDVLTKSEWHRTMIDGVTLAQSLFCWEESNTGKGQCSKSTSLKRKNSLLGGNETPLADEPPSRTANQRRRQKNRRKRRRNKKRKRKNKGRRTNRDRRAAKSNCRSHLIDSCPWPHCNCSCPKCPWATMAEVNQYFMKSLAGVMGIDPKKMQNVNLCGY